VVDVLEIQPNNADAREIKMHLERQYPELVQSIRQDKAG